MKIENRTLYIGPTGVHRLITLHNVEDVRTFVESQIFTDTQRAFVGDLSLLSPEALAVFLKFLEETKNRIACYASSDNIPPVVMSRFQKVVKSNKGRFRLGSDDFKAFINLCDEENPPTPRRLLEIAPTALSPYLLYRSLPPGVRSRIGSCL